MSPPPPHLPHLRRRSDGGPGPGPGPGCCQAEQEGAEQPHGAPERPEWLERGEEGEGGEGLL